MYTVRKYKLFIFALLAIQSGAVFSEGKKERLNLPLVLPGVNYKVNKAESEQSAILSLIKKGQNSFIVPDMKYIEFLNEERYDMVYDADNIFDEREEKYKGWILQINYRNLNKEIYTSYNKLLKICKTKEYNHCDDILKDTKKEITEYTETLLRFCKLKMEISGANISHYKDKPFKDQYSVYMPQTAVLRDGKIIIYSEYGRYYRIEKDKQGNLLYYSLVKIIQETINYIEYQRLYNSVVTFGKKLKILNHSELDNRQVEIILSIIRNYKPGKNGGVDNKKYNDMCKKLYNQFKGKNQVIE